MKRLTNSDLEKIRSISHEYFKTKTLKMIYPVAQGPEALDASVENLCHQASEAIKEGYKFIILSDRGGERRMGPHPEFIGNFCGSSTPHP